MVINTKVYSDFKAIVGAFSVVGVFYALSVTSFTGSGCSVIAAYTSDGTVVYYITNSSPPSAGTITTDFPAAIALSSFLNITNDSVGV